MRVLVRPWRRLGLRILPPSLGALAAAVAIGLGFGALMAAADAGPFRPIVPWAQTDFVRANGALDRILRLVPLSVLDEIEFRWLLMSAILGFLAAAAPAARPILRAWVAIVAAAVIYLPLHPAELGTPALLLREAALYATAGILWGCLFWRWGLVAAIAGHASAHLTLQPLLGYFFAR